MTTAIRKREIRLKPDRAFKKHAGKEWVANMRPWTEAPPFAVNPRGVLTHRVRHVTMYLRDGKESHHSIHYLCGNGCNVSPDAVDDVLVSDPPEDRLLCDHCESIAARRELPSSDELVGRHVHRGVLVPRQTCCK